MEMRIVNKSVLCDNCGYNFEIKGKFSEIHKGDITVQYFECPKCKTKYHVCTTNAEMRKLIEQRVMIQNKIAEGRKSRIPIEYAQKLQRRLDKIITRQKKLMPELKKRGAEILNGMEGEG